MMLKPKDRANELIQIYNGDINNAYKASLEIYKALKENLAAAHGKKEHEDYKYHNTYWTQIINILHNGNDTNRGRQ